ncbi:MAG: peptidoglycan DD-metalloendopeptidase family protein [Oscillospiraceae bacterium]|nr:peptidoglycan DD-metalloendopeptidase family protein [Oscillospiraceae bacterium]
MKTRKFWVGLLAGLLAAVMIFGLIAGSLANYVSAEKSSAEIKQEINQMKEQLKNNKSEVAKLKSQVKANMNKMEDIVENKNLIDQQIFLLHEQVQNLSKQITAYTNMIADKQAELDEATKRHQALSDKYKERIRAMEEDGKLSYWSVLFKANSFSDFLDRLSMIEEIAAADQRRLQELNEAAKAVEEAKTELVNEKISLEASKEELESSSEELEKSREEADKLLKQLIATGEEYQRLLDEAEKKESETASQVDKLEYAYDAAKEREYQQWLASQPPVQSGGSANTVDGLTWLLPINYTRFSSPFGYRIHPIYGDWRFHYGVDLSAPEGTPIYASRGGRVTYATYDSSSGYYVSINHLDGFTTKYLHMTHYIVSPGQYVAPGQIIGYCGSTGASTGPHLHFSVYYNGTAVNPAKYINIS